MRASLVLVIAAIVGCGGAATKPPAAPVEDAPADASAEVRGVVQEAYGSLGHGNREGVLPLLADKVHVLGPGANDQVDQRSECVVGLSGMFPADKKHRIASHALRAIVSPGGASAFVSDQVDVDGVPYAASAVMEQQGGVWVATAIVVARALPAARQGTAALPPIAGAVDPAAKGAVDELARAAARPELFVDQLADGPEVVAIGPAPKDLIRGGAAIHKAWKKALKKHPTLAIDGKVAAGATPDGQLAWVHANVTRGADGGEPSVRRGFYVYAKDGAGWRLIAAHESAVPK
jgi:hypothetical protein